MQNQPYKLLWLLLLCTNIAYSQINSNITISSGAAQLNSPTQILHVIAGESILHNGTGTTTKLQAGFHFAVPTIAPTNNSGDVTFFTNDTLVQTGNTVGIPLYIKNVPNTGIAAFQILIEFDSSQLRYSHVMDDFLGVQSNLTAPQQISCTFNSPTGFGQYIPDSTLLTYLYFEILMPHNDFSLLNNINTALTGVYDDNLNSINYNTEFDTIRAFNQATISGKVTTSTGAPMPYVAMNTSNSSISVDTTNMLGEYETLAISGSNLTITPDRNNDQNPTNGVNSLDAIRVIREILNLDNFIVTPYQHIAADVSQDGYISILDVIMIRRLVLGITTDFNGVQYKFMPSNHTFPVHWSTYPNSLSYTNVQNSINQDYIGVKLGDVDGNWNNTLRNNWSNNTVTLSIDSCHIPTQTNYSLAVKAQGMNDVSTFQMTIQWDSTVATLDAIVPNSNWIVQYNYYASNTATIIFTSSTGLGINIPDGATLFELDFKAIGVVGNYTDVEINSAITSLEAYDGNLDPLNIVTEKGLLNIVQPTHTPTIITSDFIINIFPNPFNNQFQIQIKLDAETFVDLALINTLGQTVLQQEILGSIGDNNITWEIPKYSIPPGQYFLKVTTNNEEKTVKVIKQ